MSHLSSTHALSSRQVPHQVCHGRSRRGRHLRRHFRHREGDLFSRATQVQATHLVHLAVPVPLSTPLALACTLTLRRRQRVIDRRARRARRTERGRGHRVDRACSGRRVRVLLLN